MKKIYILPQKPWNIIQDSIFFSIYSTLSLVDFKYMDQKTFFFFVSNIFCWIAEHCLLLWNPVFLRYPANQHGQPSPFGQLWLCWLATGYLKRTAELDKQCSTIQYKTFETKIRNVFWPMYLKSIWDSVAGSQYNSRYQQWTTVQSRFSDTLFSDKSRFSDNFAEDHFIST